MRSWTTHHLLRGDPVEVDDLPRLGVLAAHLGRRGEHSTLYFEDADHMAEVGQVLIDHAAKSQERARRANQPQLGGVA